MPTSERSVIAGVLPPRVQLHILRPSRMTAPPSPPILANDFVQMWQEIESDVLASVREVGESGWYILGQRVAAFESALARSSGRAQAVGCASGLDAIELALRALGLQAGERVLTTPLSAFATSLAIVRAGGVPSFVDVDASGLLRLDQLEDVLGREPSVRFCVPVHLYGHALDLEHLSALRERFSLRVVEDAAQAVGARFRGRPIGSAGDAMALSFYPTKNLGALGDGGAVLSDHADLAATCRRLRDYGQSAKYVHDELGLNSRLDELHAAILEKAMLPRLREWTERRCEIARRYLFGLQSRDVTPLPAPASSESVWHLFPVWVDPTSRTDFIAHMRARGIGVGVHYPQLINDQRALADLPVHNWFEPAQARRIAAGEVSLPIHPYLDDLEVDRVIAAVNAWRV